MEPKEKKRLEKLIAKSILKGRTGFAEAVTDERGKKNED